MVRVAEGPVLVLDAATPAQWLATHLAALDAPADPAAGAFRWAGPDDLLADGAAPLRDAHARIVAERGASPAAAAKWLVSWFAGRLAGAVGFTFGAVSAGLLVEQASIRWRLHPGGWPDRVEPGEAPVAVGPAHPWAGQPGVRVLPDDDAVAAAAVAALGAAVAPLVEAGHGLARVGRSALWTEVADRFALSVLFRPALPVDPLVARRLHAALRAPTAPWRRYPELRVAATARGRDYLGRKAGCCLAYQASAAGDLDDRTCMSCSLRELGDCEARQEAWLQQGG